MDAATFALSALLLLAFVRERILEVTGTPGGALHEAAAGFRLVMGSRRLRGLLGWGLLSAASVIAAEGLAVTISEERGGGPLAAGILTAAVPAGFLIGSWALLRLPTHRREPLFPYLIALGCVPLLVTPFVDNLLAIVALWVLAGCGNCLQIVANSAYVQTVPPHLRGRAFGVAGTLLMVLQGVVLLSAGALAEVTDPRVPIAVVAAACLLVVPLLPTRTQGVTILSRSVPG